MSATIVAAVGAAVVGGAMANKGSKAAAAAAADKDTAASTSGFENQSGTNDVTAELKALGYSDEQIKELTQSVQQQQSQESSSQSGQTQTATSGSQSGSTVQNQISEALQQQSENQIATGTQTTTGTQATVDNQVSVNNQSAVGNQTTAQQLTDNLSQVVQGSQTQGAVLNQFQAGNVNPAQQLFDATAAGISPEQYQAIVAKAGQDLAAQTPGLAKQLATASGTSTANNSGLAIGLEQARQQAAVNAAAQSVAASQGNQQIAANAAGTIAGATTGNNQTLEQWLQQQTSASQQQQVQATTGTQATTNNVVNTGTQANTSNTATTGVQANTSNTATTGTQATTNNTATTGTSNQVSQDLSNQLATQTGSQTANNTTTGTQSSDRSAQAVTGQNTNQTQSTVSTGASQYGESSVTDVDSLRVPTISGPGQPYNPSPVGPPTPARVQNPNGGIPADVFVEDGFAEGGLISGSGSALPGRSSSKGTANARGSSGSAAAAQILMQDANRKAAAVNNAAGVLSKYFATPVTDKDGKQLKNSDGTPIYPAQNITDALKSATSVGDFFSRVGKAPPAPAVTTPPVVPAPAPQQPMSFGNFGGFDTEGFATGGLISGPGTGTSDSIPAVVDGKKPIAVSDGEYVIPTHVVDAVGVDYFDSLLAHFQNAKI